jgi:ABC-2 type transport system permease protein
VTILLYVIFLAAIMSVSFTVGSGTGTEEEMIGPMFSQTLESVCGIYPPAAWFVDAVMKGSLSSALLFIGASLLAFSVVAVVFGEFYGKIHEIFRPRSVQRTYKSREKASGVMLALMKKDAKRIVSSTNVFMNQLVGLLMLVVFAVMFSIQDFGVAGEEMGEFFSILFPFVFAMAAAMVNDTTTAISLEGKTFPLLKSLPISPRVIIRSKLYLHMAFCSPVILICGIAVSVANKLPLMGAIASVMIPLCYAYSAGIIGLLIDLKKYKFDWTSEIMIVKNNLPMVFTMLGGMACAIIPMIISIILSTIGIPLVVILGFFILLSLITAGLMTVLLNTRGEKLFLKIEC